MPKSDSSKNPFAIREVSSVERGVVSVHANNGMTVRVHARDVQGRMPKLREDIRNYDMLEADRGGVICGPKIAGPHLDTLGAALCARFRQQPVRRRGK